ncbi:MAG: ComF family protein [Opitutaceae bacterium]|nr:ComF family protein [Opitutaceae bacterium]
MNAMLADLVRAGIDVFFPRVCVHCGGVGEGGRLRHLCPRCESGLSIVCEPYCTVCGHPFSGAMEAGRECPHCVELAPEFGQGRTCILLKNAGRSLVHALKYRHALHVLEDIAELWATVPGVADYVREAVLVPVPLHPRKERERGYNQSRLLAEIGCRASGGTARVEPILRRVVDTKSQTHYNRQARQLNLKNAFALAPRADIKPAQRYVLIDDVFTTGSTLNACAAVLRRAGCLNVDVLTFGHG